MQDSELDPAVCRQAMLARDARFDGRFFIGVRTTGIFCRPVCRVRTPRPENVLFFKSSAAALEAGFRPCLRCRPESAPGTPAWAGTSTTVSRGLRLIDETVCEDFSVARLAERLGVSTRHLGRLFQQHLGASPKAIAQARRLHFAKQLVDETRLPMTDVALASGYRSVRRFNDHFRQVYGRAPSGLRAGGSPADGSLFSVRVPYREPFAWTGILAFLAKRAVPGVERVEGGAWIRHVRIGNGAGRIEVRQDRTRRALLCTLDAESPLPLYAFVQRIRSVFDLDADPAEVHRVLGKDAVLARLLRRDPGLRLPGAWDGFELAVRAIVGQQVSVGGATTVMGRIAGRFGEVPRPDLRLFPCAEALARARAEELPMPRTRAETVIRLSRAVVAGEIELGRWADPGALKRKLLQIRGIGPWTASYIAMRGLGDPDEFLHSDLVLLKAARALYGDSSPRQLLDRSQAWRPWRAYAAMHLWQAASTQTVRAAD